MKYIIGILQQQREELMSKSLEKLHEAEVLQYESLKLYRVISILETGNDPYKS